MTYEEKLLPGGRRRWQLSPKLTPCPRSMATVGHREAAKLSGRGGLGDHRRKDPLNGMTRTVRLYSFPLTDAAVDRALLIFKVLKWLSGLIGYCTGFLKCTCTELFNVIFKGKGKEIWQSCWWAEDNNNIKCSPSPYHQTGRTLRGRMVPSHRICSALCIWAPCSPTSTPRGRSAHGKQRRELCWGKVHFPWTRAHKVHPAPHIAFPAPARPGKHFESTSLWPLEFTVISQTPR